MLWKHDAKPANKFHVYSLYSRCKQKLKVRLLTKLHKWPKMTQHILELNPWKLTYSRKINGWKTTFPFEMVPFWGHILYFQVGMFWWHKISLEWKQRSIHVEIPWPRRIWGFFGCPKTSREIGTKVSAMEIKITFHMGHPFTHFGIKTPAKHSDKAKRVREFFKRCYCL